MLTSILQRLHGGFRKNCLNFSYLFEHLTQFSTLFVSMQMTNTVFSELAYKHSYIYTEEHMVANLKKK